MTASPNAGQFILDGDGDAHGIVGPPGSDHIEHTFQTYYNRSAPVRYDSSAFSGRSDYGPFLTAGIPAGGLQTGAEGIMTAEQAGWYVQSNQTHWSHSNPRTQGGTEQRVWHTTNVITLHVTPLRISTSAHGLSKPRELHTLLRPTLLLCRGSPGIVQHRCLRGKLHQGWTAEAAQPTAVSK